MKLLLFSDLHGNAQATSELLKKSQSVDVLVGAGDFSNARQGISTCIDVLKTVDQPTILVPGNSESEEELRAACRGWSQAHVLHGSGTTVNRVQFYGIGGGIPLTPFGPWSYDFTEEEAKVLLANCPERCVLISHSPPKGAVDISSSGDSLGSLAVREIIMCKRPLLVVCGHIHHSAGKTAKVGDCIVIKAGPWGIEFELDEIIQ